MCARPAMLPVPHVLPNKAGNPVLDQEPDATAPPT
ncbi:MAG: hypothetical protein QOE62_467, partial [Actinomycetota bacterium]|nr:hypothetical protein [Actinomycetota bacterium]